MNRPTKIATAIALLCAASSNGWATNGMNLEGYGSKATAMGGASTAYDTGNSAVMNNPATLSLMKPNARFGLGLRNLRPDVESRTPLPGVGTESGGDSYFMPSISYMRRSGSLTYGAAIKAQGGMGTEYGKPGASDLFSGHLSMLNAPTPLSGMEARSELGVGRLMLPLSYQANDRLTIGGSLDFVWAMLDMQMDMSGAQFAQLMAGNGGKVGGSMAALIPPAIPALGNDVNWARFDFSDSSDYTGKAKGYGLGAKFGLTYAVNDSLRLGFAYHTKTDISDLKADNQTMSFSGPAATFNLKGDYRVNDFQWPATWAIGLAYQPSEKWLFVSDLKLIEWNDVMDEFNVSFKASSAASNGGFANSEIDVTLDQGWEDQVVLQLGVQYQATPKLALRAGLSISDNPIPDTLVNPLFPAIVETHYTAGFGYQIDSNQNIAFSLAYAPETKVTGSGPLNNGITITHSQLNWTLNYLYSF
ncbi:MAG: outer membrane protein transport protein [Gammaproteobacteria bacterium]|nr:outer membrane protein transport protein [Gammaproteobacteria bacterium]